MIFFKDDGDDDDNLYDDDHDDDDDGDAEQKDHLDGCLKSVELSCYIVVEILEKKIVSDKILAKL